MKIMYLHIGMPKTGTTSIQSFLMRNQDVLKKNGYAFPLMPFTFGRQPKSRNAHFMVQPVFRKDGERDLAQEESNFATGFSVIEKAFEQYDYVILSDEGIWNKTSARKPKLWEQLKEKTEEGHFQIIFIVYLRRQDEYLASWWNQNVKAEFRTKKFEDFRRQIPPSLVLDYFEHLEKIAAHFGRESIRVRLFEPQQFVQGNICADFLDALDLPFTDEYEMDDVQENDSLQGNTHEIKRLLNGMPSASRKVLISMRESLLACSRGREKGDTFSIFTKTEASRFLKQYEASNAKIAKLYLHGKKKKLFDETMKDLPKYKANNPYMIEDVIRFFGDVCMKQEQRIDQLEKQLEELQKNTPQA